MRLLIIDGDKNFPSGYLEGFEREGFGIDKVLSINKGEWLLSRNNYDLVIFKEGDKELIKKLIQNQKVGLLKSFLILIRDDLDSEEKIDFYHSGVDEIIVSPFSFAEILLRVKILSRFEKKSDSEKNGCFIFDDLSLDLNRYKVFRGGREIQLRRKEFDLLYYLVINQGIVLNKIMILERVWDINQDIGTNTLEVHIRGLRQKIDRGYAPAKRLIHTIYGRGYYFGFTGSSYSSVLASGSC